MAFRMALTPHNQSMDPSTGRLINRSMDEPMDRRFIQSMMHHSNDCLLNGSIDESMDQSINQSIKQSINQSINQSIKQSINQQMNE